MKRINSLSDLLMEELADLLNAENQLVEALPKMAQVGQSSALKTVLEDHLKVVQDQADRLHDIFSNIGQEPSNQTCKAIQRLIADCEYVVNKTEEGAARDAALVSVMQQVEQHEINEYQTACEHAVDLGHTGIVELLNKTLDEERTMNLRLNELAQGVINIQTIDPQGRGFYMPEGKFRKKGIKKKNTDESRFISEGNPNVQEPQENEQEKKEKNLKNPEEEGDQS